MESDNSENKQNLYDLKPWLFKPGQSGNPAGRPKGSKSLKTYAKEYLESLSDEEKMEFMRGLDKDTVWKMAEGNPKQDTDITTNGKDLPAPILGINVPSNPSSQKDSEAQEEA